MGVRALFAIAAVVAIAIALLLPTPRSTQAEVPKKSQIPTMDISQG